METQPYDVVVVGGGAAGLSAALVLGRSRRRVAVIDAGAPRNAPSEHLHGFLSRDGMPPADLLTAGRGEVTSYGVEIVDDRVLWIEPGFSVCLTSGAVLEARKILVATGASDRLPAIPGAADRWGRDLLHCPYCHGWEVRGKPLGVLATGNGSVDQALLLRQWSADVVFFAHRYGVASSGESKLAACGIEVVRGEVTRIVVEADRLRGVELEGGRVVERTAVFLRPENRPHLDAVRALRCDVDDAGFILVDDAGRTSTPGVWAAGNVVDARASVIMSAGAGAAAAMSINAALVEDDVEAMLNAVRS